MIGKPDLINTLMFHYTLYHNKAVLDQLKSGLCLLGVLDAMIRWPNILRELSLWGKTRTS